jgi:hypothetical protein
MSIPDRLFRLARGYWSEAADRIEGTQAQADAYQELADVLRKPEPVPGQAPAPGAAAPATPLNAGAGQHDRLEAAFGLLRIEPGATCEALEEAYEARMEELKPEQHPAGSAERQLIEARRSAVEAAYEKLRDHLNPVETRFERLEF